MVDLSEALKVLEGLDNGASLVSAVKSELSKKNNEAQNLRSSKKEALDEVYSMFGLSSESGADAIKKALEAKDAEKDKGSQTEIEKLSGQLRQFAEDLEKSKAQAESERTKRINLKKESALKGALESAGAYGADVLVKSLINEISMDDTDNISFNGDDNLSLADGVKSFLDSNPGFVKNNQTPGSESPDSDVNEYKKYDQHPDE